MVNTTQIEVLLEYTVSSLHRAFDIAFVNITDDTDVVLYFDLFSIEINVIIQLRGIIFECLFRLIDCRQLLVLDLDRAQRLKGQLFRVSSDSRNSLADVTAFVAPGSHTAGITPGTPSTTAARTCICSGVQIA